MQMEANQSKPSPGLLPLCMHCEFKANTLFLILLLCESVPLSQRHLSSPRGVFFPSELNTGCFCSLLFFFFFCFFSLTNMLLRTNGLLVGKKRRSLISR